MEATAEKARFIIVDRSYQPECSCYYPCGCGDRVFLLCTRCGRRAARDVIDQSVADIIKYTNEHDCIGAGT